MQFFCFDKPIGITLGCFDRPKPMLLPQNCTNLMDFLFKYYIQFFCFDKLIGITLGCFNRPKPMLLP